MEGVKEKLMKEFSLNNLDKINKQTSKKKSNRTFIGYQKNRERLKNYSKIRTGNFET